VGLGSYIINAQGGCNDCHRCPTYKPGHAPYISEFTDAQFNDKQHLSGGVPFQLGPGVTIYSANLTPNAKGLPEGSTLDQFIHTIRTGQDPIPPHRRLQVMPWPTFRFMTDRDLSAIYEYLSALPHQDTPAPGSCQNPGQ
jgi:hypothetical protein